MYREIPSAVIPGAVVWHRSPVVRAGVSRILPDGCLDILWSNDELVVAGPDTTAQFAPCAAGQRYTGLRFGPGIGPAVLGLPASELTDRRVPLTDIWPKTLVDEAAEQIHEGTDASRVLETLAARRLRRGDGPDPLMHTVATRLQAGDSVTATAHAVNLSPRHLHRRALAAFGYGPKTLARILRLGRALDLARDGVPYAHVAATTGYTDQAHLSREVKALAGAPLGVVLA